MNFRVFESPDATIEAVELFLLDQTRDADQCSIIGLSGGSTPKRLYRRLGQGDSRDRLAAREVSWVVEDERHLPPDHPESNLRMIHESLFREGLPAGHSLTAFDTTLEPAACASDFEDHWRRNNVDHLDLAILGVGDDGHTASLFPGTTALDVIDRIATEVFVPKLDMWRLTLTLPVLQEARMKVVIATGAGKKAVLAKIAGGEAFPITSVTESGGEAWWFVDRDAYPG